jgi:hypothetical protein
MCRCGCIAGVDVHIIDFVTILIVLESKDIDIILGMDWLSKHKVLIDWAKESVVTTKGIVNHAKVNQLDASQGSEVPVVSEFLDVFSDELPGMSPDRDIEFMIELMPTTTPIYMSTYRMATPDLVVFKEHIRELLEKGFIHPRLSL